MAEAIAASAVASVCYSCVYPWFFQWSAGLNGCPCTRNKPWAACRFDCGWRQEDLEDELAELDLKYETERAERRAQVEAMIAQQDSLHRKVFYGHMAKGVDTALAGFGTHASAMGIGSPRLGGGGMSRNVQRQGDGEGAAQRRRRARDPNQDVNLDELIGGRATRQRASVNFDNVVVPLPGRPRREDSMVDLDKVTSPGGGRLGRMVGHAKQYARASPMVVPFRHRDRSEAVDQPITVDSPVIGPPPRV